MAVTYPGTITELGAELQVLRACEVPWEYASLVSGANTYLRDKLNTVYDNTVTNEDDAELASKNSLESDMEVPQADIHEARKAAFEEYWLEQYLGVLLLGLDEDEASGGAIQYEYDEALLTLGQVQISARKGPLGRLNSDMVTNAQTILRPTRAAAAIVANSANVGALVEASVTVQDHSLAGTINIECVDDTIGATTFEVSLTLDVPLVDGTRTIEADNAATLARAFEDGPTGLAITLGYGTLVESGDGGNMFSATAIATPGESDSNKGTYFIRVVRMSGTGGNPDFRIYWYNDSSQLPDELIATQDITGVAGTTAVTLTGITSVITTTFSMTNAAVALPTAGNEDSDITFNIDNPRIGDRWTKVVTNDQAGLFASKIARRWRASLPSALVGNTIVDSTAASVSMA